MADLFKIDYRKYFYSRTFWIMILIYLVLMVLVFSGVESFLNTALKNANTNSPVPMPEFSLYSFPYVWQNLTFLGGFFKIFLGIIIIIFIANEFTNKTIRQNIINGMSREQFILSKVIFVFLLSFVSMLILFVTGGIMGMLHTPDLKADMMFQKTGFLGAYFLELFTFGAMSLLIAFLIKKPGPAIALLALYYYIAEPVVSRILPAAVSRYLPVVSLGNLIDVPNSSLMKMFGINFREYVSVPDVFISLAWSIAFIGIIYLILRKQDV